MKKPIYGVLLGLAFVVLTAAGASRYINGTEIKQSVTLLNTTDAAVVGSTLAVTGAATFASTVGVTGAVGITGDLTVRDDVIVSDIADAVTADTGSAQGGGAITGTIVRVSTSATNGDAVTLPAAAAGLVQVVCNHAAANSVDAFPASGDAINGAGANTAIALAAGECMICFAANATNWGCVIGSAT
jgi:hypothetical protein